MKNISNIISKRGKKEIQSAKNLKQLILINCLIFAMINVACKREKIILCLSSIKIISPAFFFLFQIKR